MRVTFNHFPDTLLGRLQSLGREQNKALIQLSTGQRIDAPSDDAPAMQRVLNLRTEKKQNQQFYRNAIDGLERSKVTFSSLEQIKDLLVRASELSANISGASSEQEYKAKAAEIDQLIQQGVNTANTKLRGNYLFSGDTTLRKPFEENRSGGKINSISYAGSSEEPKIRIGEGDTSVLSVAATSQENGDIAGILNEMIRMRDTMLEFDANKVIALRTGSALDGSFAANNTGQFVKLPDGHGLKVGDKITLPNAIGGLAANTDYFIKSVDNNTIEISATNGGDPISVGTLLNGATYNTGGTSGTFGEVLSKTIQLQVNHGLKAGDKIKLPAAFGGLTEGKAYFVKSVAGNSIEISDVPGGPALRITTAETLPNSVPKFERIGGLGELEDKLLSALSRAGTVQYRLETAMKDLEVRYEATEQLISTDADIDFAEATIRLNRAQTAYQAAIQSGANIQSRSLLDYLR